MTISFLRIYRIASQTDWEANNALGGRWKGQGRWEGELDASPVLEDTFKLLAASISFPWNPNESFLEAETSKWRN